MRSLTCRVYELVLLELDLLGDRQRSECTYTSFKSQHAEKDDNMVPSFWPGHDIAATWHHKNSTSP